MKRISFNATMRMMVAIVCVGLAFTASAARPSAEYDALLDKAVTLSIENQDLNKVMESSLQQLVDQGMISQANLAPLSADIVNMILPRMKSVVKSAWADAFTENELREIVKWEESTVGKKMMGMSAQMMGRMQKEMQDPAIMQQMQTVMMKYMGK